MTPGTPALECASQVATYRSSLLTFDMTSCFKHWLQQCRMDKLRSQCVAFMALALATVLRAL